MGDPFQGGIRFEIPAENKARHCRGCFTGRTEKVKVLYFGSSSVL
jgi:hypothetical protein